MKVKAKIKMRLKARKRRHERIAVSFPVYQNQGNGLTRNISAAGIYFESGIHFGQGAPIDFIVDLDANAERYQRRCLVKYQGEVVRIEQRGSRIGVAVKITDSELKYVQD
jgi:hypothetical protein